MEVPKLNEFEERALDDASLDLALGKNHYDTHSEIKEESKGLSDPVTSLYLGTDSGYTRKDDLKSRAGLNKDANWTQYVNNGGAIPEGYEIESRLTIAEERRRDLYNRYQSGNLSDSDFLFEAYGRDYMKAKYGDDLSSVSYWYNRFKQGYTGSPLDSDTYLEDVLSQSEAMFKADTAIRDLYEPKAHYENGQVVDEKTFAEMFGQQFSNEYVEELGGYGALISKYKAGFLSIDPFIDANNDGKISDGDYYYHDDGRVYKIGTGAFIKQTDKDGRPTEVHVGKVGVGDHLKTFFVGLGEGLLGIGESICQLGALIADVFVPGEFTLTKEFTEKSEAWKNSIKIGDTSVFNDDMWVAPGTESTTSNINQVVDVLGNISGMILGSVATMGASNILNAQKAALTATDEAAKIVIQGGKKIGLKEGMKLVKDTAKATGKSVGLQSTKYLGLDLLSKVNNTIGASMQFSQGVFKTSAKAGGEFMMKTTKDMMRYSVSGLARSAASAAILTSRDFVDNLARSAAINDSMINPDGTKMDGYRTGSELFWDAAGIAAINFGISTALRATWDDVGLTGRVGQLAEGLTANPTPSISHPFADWLVKATNSGSRLNAIIDTLSDSAEMVFTNINNQFTQQGGFSSLTGEDWSNSAAQFLKSPAGITSLLFSSYSTYKGAFGKNNFGTAHHPYDYAAAKSKELVSNIQSKFYDIVNKINLQDKSDTNKANIQAAIDFVNDFGARDTDRVRLFNDVDGKAVFGATCTKDGKVVINKTGKLIIEDGAYNGAKGTIVFSTDPAEGEFNVTSIPQSFASTLNIIRLKQELGESASGPINEAMHELLDGINVDLLARKQYQVAATLSMAKEFRNETSKIAFDSEARKSFFNRLKDKNIVDQMENISKRFSKSKWAKVMEANDLGPEVERWKEIIKDPEKLFYVGDAANSATFDKFSEITNSQNREYFIDGNLEDLAQIATGVKGTIKNKDVTTPFDAKETKRIAKLIRKVASTHNISQSELSGLSFKKLKTLKDLGAGSNKPEVQPTVAKLESEARFLSKITSVDKFGADKFFVEEMDGEYYFFVTPSNDGIDFIRNNTFTGKALTAAEIMATGNLREKAEATTALIEILTKDLGSDTSLRQSQTETILRAGVDEGILSSREALSIAKQIPNISKFNDTALKFYLEIDNKLNKVNNVFNKWKRIAEDPDLGKGSNEYNKTFEDYMKEAGELKTLLNSNKEFGIVTIEDTEGNTNIVPNSTKAAVSDKGGILTVKEYNDLTNIKEENFNISRLGGSDSAYSKDRNRVKLTRRAAKSLVDKTLGKVIKDISKDIEHDIKKINKQAKFSELFEASENRLKDNGKRTIKEDLSELEDFLTRDTIVKGADPNYDKNILAKENKFYDLLYEIEDILSGKFSDAEIKNQYGMDSTKKIKEFFNFIVNEIGDILDPKIKETSLRWGAIGLGDTNQEHERNLVKKMIRTIPKNTEQLLKQNFYEDIKHKYPIFTESIDNNSNELYENKIHDPNVSLDEFTDLVYENSTRNNLKENITNTVMRMAEAYKDTSYIRKNRRFVVNLAELKTSQELDIAKTAEIDFFSGKKSSDKDAFNDIINEHNGADAIVKSSKKLSDMLISNKGKPYLVFDLDVETDLQAMKDLFNALGYEDFNEDSLASIPGVEYRPNADEGFDITSSFNVKDSFADLKLDEILNDDGTIKIDAKQRVFNLAMNEVSITDDSPVDLNTIAFVLADITSPNTAKEIRGEIELYSEQGLKMGKAASGAANLVSQIITGIKSYTGGEDTKNYTSLQTIYSIRQALEVCNLFFDKMDLSQSKSNVKVLSKNVKDLENVGFIIKNNIVTGFDYTEQSMINAYNILHRGGNIDQIIPISNKTYTYLQDNSVYPKDKNIFAFGKNLAVDQDVYENNFDNFLGTKLDELRGNGFDSLNRLACFNNKNKSKGDLIPIKFTFKNNNFSDCDTFGKLKDKVNNGLKKDKNDFYLLQLQTQIIGLEELSKGESQYKFLAEPSIRKTIIENLDKPSKEIMAILSKLKYKKPSHTSSTNISTKDMFNIEFKEDGYTMEEPYVNSKSAEALGITVDEKTFKSLLDTITLDDIERLQRETLELASSNNTIYKIGDMSDEQIADRKVDAILNRTIYSDTDDGLIHYQISVDDLVSMDEFEIERLIKRLDIKQGQANKIRKSWSIINNIIMQDIKEFRDIGVTDELVLKQPLSENIRSVSVPAEKVSSSEVALDRIIQTEINRAYKLTEREVNKIFRTKMVSLNSKFGDEFGLQYGLDKYISNNSLITNDGNRTMYNMQNKYQAAKFFHACVNMEEILKEELSALKINNINDEYVVDKAMQIIAKTTGVEVSDGFESVFMFQENGDMTSAVRLNRFRENDSTDSLLEYFKLKAQGKKPKAILVLDKNAGIESGNIKIIEVNNDVDNAMSKAFFEKTVYEKRLTETPEDFWKRQIPRVKVNKIIADNLIKELNLPEEYTPVFRNSAIAIAKSFEDDYASFSYEAFVNFIMDRLELPEESPEISRDQFNKIRNRSIQSINDIIKYAVSEDYLPENLNSKLKLFGREISDKASRTYNQAIQEHRAFTYNGTASDFATAHVLNSNKGVNKAFVIRTLMGKELDSNEGVVGGAYDKWTNLKPTINKSTGEITSNGKPFICFDTEWIWDNNRNRYLTQIALRSYKYNENGDVVPVGKVLEIHFNTANIVGTYTKNNLTKFSDYITEMKKKLNRENYQGDPDTYIREALQSTDMIIENGKARILDIKESENIIRKYIKDSNAEYFLSYNGKGNNSDIDVMNSLYSPIKFMASGKDPIITNDNHIDGYKEMVRILRPSIDDSIEIDYDDASNSSLYKKISEYKLANPDKFKGYKAIDLSKAHDAETDLRMTVEVIDTLFKDKPSISKSQLDEFKDNLEVQLRKAGFIKENDSKEYVDILLSNTINDIKNKIKDNSKQIKLTKEDKAFMERISKYKTLSNEGMRKALNTVNAYRKSQDLKSRNYMIDELLDSMFGKRAKPLMDSLINNYDEGRNLIAYITCKETVNGYNDISSKYYYAEKILTEMFGEGKESLSRYNTFEAFDKLIKSDRVEEFFTRMNNVIKFKEDGLSLEDMQNKRYSMNQVNEIFNDIKTKTSNAEMESLKKSNDPLYYTYSMISQDTSNIDKNSFLYKIMSATDFIDFDNNMSEINIDENNSFNNAFKEVLLESYSDLIDDSRNVDLYNTMYAKDLTGRKMAIEEAHILFKEPFFLNELRKIVQDGRTFTRSWSKAIPIMPNEIIKDITGKNVVVDSGSVVISKSSFEEIFKAKYEDVINEYDGEIVASVLRQPSDKPSTLNPFKVIVVPDKQFNDKTIRVTPLSIFSKMAGDFDGDTITLYRPTVEESKFLKEIRTKSNKAFNALDDIYAEALKFSNTIKGPSKKSNKHGKVFINDDYIKITDDFNNNSKEKEFVTNKVNEALQYFIDNKGVSFNEKYNDIINEINNELKKYKYNDDQIDMIIKLFFLERKDVNNDQYLYLLRNNEVYNKLSQDQKDLIDDMKIKYIHASGVHKSTQNAVASDTGSAERYSLFEDINGVYDISKLKYRSISLDTEQELLLRQFFDKESNQALIPESVKNLVNKYSKNKVDKILFEDFIIALSLEEKNSQKNVNTFMQKNLDKLDQMQKDLKIKNQARELAYSIYDMVSKTRPVSLERDNDIYNNMIANRIVENIYGEIENKTTEYTPEGLPEGYVIYPIQTKEGLNAPLLESFIFEDDYLKDSTFFVEKRINMPEGTSYKEGDFIKSGTILNGKEISTDGYVSKKLPNNTLIIVSQLDKGLAPGTKLYDAENLGSKMVVGILEDSERSRIKRFRDAAIRAGINSKNIVGYSYIEPTVKKNQKTFDPNNVITIKDENGHIIGMAIKEKLSAIEDSSQYNSTVDEKEMDHYSIMNNAMTATGLVMVGDIFLKKENGKWIVDTNLQNHIKNVTKKNSDRVLGKTDGRPLYQKMVIYSLIDLLGNKIPKAEIENYAKFISMNESGGPDGLNVILEILDKYYYDKDSKTIKVGPVIDKKIKEIEDKTINLNSTMEEFNRTTKLAKEKTKHLRAMKAILSDQLFEEAFGVTYTGLRKDGEFNPGYSKSSFDKQVLAESGAKSFGKDYTTNRKTLVDTNRYSDEGYISTLELINTINKALGKGIITDLDAITFNKPSKLALHNKYNGASEYAYDPKFGLHGVSKQKTVGESGSDLNETEWNKYFNDLDNSYEKYKKENFRYGDDNKGHSSKDFDYDYRNRNNFLKLNSKSALKFRALKDFYNGDVNTAYDRIRLIERGAKDKAYFVEPTSLFRPSISIDENGNKKIFNTIDPYADYMKEVTRNMPRSGEEVKASSNIKTASELYNLRHDEEHRTKYKNPTYASVFSDNDLGEETSKELKSQDSLNRINAMEEYRESSYGKNAETISAALNSIKAKESIDVNEINNQIPLPKKLNYTATVSYENVDNVATTKRLADSGMRFNSNDEGIMAREAWAETRYDKATLDSPKVISDSLKEAREREFDMDASIDSLRNAIYRSNDDEYTFNKYMSTRGITDSIKDIKSKRMKQDSKGYKDTISRLELALKELGLNNIEEAESFMNNYEQRNPLVVREAIALTLNATEILNEINKNSGNRLSYFSLMLIQKANPSSNGKKLNLERFRNVLNNMFKRKTVEGIKGEYTEKDLLKDNMILGNGGYVNFIENMQDLSRSMIKTQTIYRCAKKLPKDNAIIKNLIQGIFDESFKISKDGLLYNQELGTRSKYSRRQEMLNIISLRLNTKLNASDNASYDYVNAINKVKEIKDECLAVAGFKQDVTLDELNAAKNNTITNDTLDKAILAYESLYELYHSALATSPSLQENIIKALKETTKSGKVSLVDHLGRRINPTYGPLSDIARKPISNIDFTYIRDAIIDCPDNEHDYNLTLAVRALTGEVYLMDSLVTKKMEEQFFTREIPSPVMAAIQKSSRWCAKALMSQPLKIIRRLMQFSLYDFNMAMTVNPNTVKYMAKSRKDLSAFFQSKGAVCSPELRDYLQHQGFDYKDIQGYDPTQMEATNDHSIMDKAYFDKVNNKFSMQNLFVRYALYSAEKDSFKNDVNPYYGVMYHRKDYIDKLHDDGLKAMEVIDATLGGPHGFSEVSKELGKYGFVFTTFPLAVARWAGEGCATVKSLFTNIGESNFETNWKHLGSPLVTMGATYGILYGIITALCNMFGLDEEDAEELAREQEFIDPINSILSEGIVKVSDNSIFQLQAIIDAFDSFKEEETFGSKVLGFVNDNFLSHFNPMLKAGVETMFGKDLYGGKVVKNDYSVLDNAERKMLGFLIGSSGATALVKEKEAQRISGDKSIQDKITSVLSAEIGNTKAYKSDKKSYQKALSYINDYINSQYENNKHVSKEGISRPNIYSLSNKIKNAMEDNKGMDRIISIIDNAIKEGYNQSEIRSAIKSISLIGKLEKIETLGLSEEFYDNMSTETKNQFTRAIQYEQKYFPYVQDLLELYNLDENNKYYSKDKYLKKFYMRNFYDDLPKKYNNYNKYNNYVKPNYYYQGKSQRGNTIPSIKDLFIYRLTNYTGKKPISIDDLIGEYYDYYFDDYDGKLSGEKYKDRKNKKQAQSDWRNQ